MPKPRRRQATRRSSTKGKAMSLVYGGRRGPPGACHATATSPPSNLGTRWWAHIQDQTFRSPMFGGVNGDYTLTQ